MADLSTHYKERSPQETVQIVKDFFTSKGLKVIETELIENEAGTWSNHLELYQDKVWLAKSNGKGMTKDYCRASGYAELYERFCNGMVFLGNPWWNMAITEANYKKHGYYLREDEKILTFNELYGSCYRTERFFDFFCIKNEAFQKTTADYITHGKYIGLPLKNISNENDQIYIDPRVLLRITNSVGMAAGNTLEEALVQGCSEIVEKYASAKLYNDFYSKSFTALKLENIENENLQKIIKQIKDLGYELYIYDLSYSYQVPVLMSLIRNPMDNLINVNFGAFPVFDIALERVLTELYQGHKSYHDPYLTRAIQIPLRPTNQSFFFQHYSEGIMGDIWPENFLDNVQYADTYNHDVFVNKEVSNKELIPYFDNLAKQFNTKYYYLNNSLSSDFYAIHILCDGQDTYIGEEMYQILLDDLQIRKFRYFLPKFTQLYDGIYNNNVDYVNFLEILTNQNSDLFTDGFLGKMRMWNDFTICARSGGMYDNLLYLITSDITGGMYDLNIGTVPDDLLDSFLYVPFKKYLQLKTYMGCNMYKSEELLKIFNTFFNYNLTQEDIEKCSNNAYVLKKAYVEPLHNYLHSKEYEQLINIFIK